MVYDPLRDQTLVLGNNGVDILGSDDGTWLGGLTATSLASIPGDALNPGDLGGGNSVAVRGNLVAVAFSGAAGAAPGSNGWVGLYTLDAAGSVTSARAIESGATPDMVTFTPNGRHLLVAVEGEPTADYASDPVGGIQIIDTATGKSSFAGFGAFDTDILREAGVRITGPVGTLATTDLEPEYIALSADGRKAYVTLQENNAVGVLDLAAKGGPAFTDVFALGAKDFSLKTAGLDASDRDDSVGNIQPWPIQGLYMPDGIATFDRNGKTYLVTANEGDAREYGDYTDVARINTLTLDPKAFPDAASLQENANLGRLEVLTTEGGVDGDGDYDALYTLGGRSFSIWEVQKNGLKLTFDSADLIERTLLQTAPSLLDDSRSDNKGPEPEHVAVATLDGEVYAFVGLERSNSIMAFHVDGPRKASFAGLIATPGDVGPEIFTVVDAPGRGKATLYAANEVSGTSRAYAFSFGDDNTLRCADLRTSDLDLF
ncbi:choice-of-anchor I family protein [Belnapia sp. T6]|uniref:Choice-of-anchor I family protein n=1 Tax=Belnapia mucosa TaxID=2804532 RepID=A0ABS1VCU2_9PROT|nr:choice-of-anchor I family protein [Belnapia mucosa]MBL6459490.1 choice-of-anchor I family protein [Belnapia mucosa]